MAKKRTTKSFTGCVICVEWIDTKTYGGWHEKTSSDRLADFPFHQARTWGICLEDTAERILVAGTDSPGGDVSDVTTIPRGCIKRVAEWAAKT